MLRLLPVLVAIPLVIGFGVGEGLWTNRWGLYSSHEEAVARLQKVPLLVGDWHGRERTLDPRRVAQGKLYGYLLRDYTNLHTGETVQVLLVCGPGRDVAQHPPEACYGGAGYKMVGSAPHVVTAESLDQLAAMRVATFKIANEVLPEQLRIFWAWSADGSWEVPEYPRFTYASEQVLYKLYVIRQLTSVEELLEEEPAAEFLRLFLPEVNNQLFKAGQ
jgi:hypothetical protein